MVRLITLLALAFSLPYIAAQEQTEASDAEGASTDPPRLRPGFRNPGFGGPGPGGPGFGIDCVLEVNSLFPAIAKTIVNSQQVHRNCADCWSNSVLDDGNSSRTFSEWEDAKLKLESECATQDAEVCMASVSIKNLESHRLFRMKDYTPTCMPRKCNIDDFGSMRALRRFSRNRPSNLFWYPPAESDPVLDECNNSGNCIFIFDFCGVEMSMGYDPESIESFSTALAASVAQSSATVVDEGIIVEEKANKDDSSKAEANEQDDSNSGLPIGMLAAVIGGALIIILAIAFAVVRSRKPAVQEFI